jgi:hypothetical protein
MKNMQKRAPNDSHFRLRDRPPAGNPVGRQQVTRDPGVTREPEAAEQL